MASPFKKKIKYKEQTFIELHEELFLQIQSNLRLRCDYLL